MNTSLNSSSLGFLIRNSGIVRNILLPKYYDPEERRKLQELEENHILISVGELVKKGYIALSSGNEIGKMAYGTGNIPFIRTSDISNWELKADPKQGVSEEIYEKYKQDIKVGDIFIVRDGTYLVGTSAILTKYDTKILYCGGLYKLRSIDHNKLSPYLLISVLNMPIVKKQIRSKQFTRDIIDTLGKRLFEVILPIPIEEDLKEKITSLAKQVIEGRVMLREQATRIAKEVEAS